MPLTQGKYQFGDVVMREERRKGWTWAGGSYQEDSDDGGIVGNGSRVDGLASI